MSEVPLYRVGRFARRANARAQSGISVTRRVEVRTVFFGSR